ncbi:MAG: molecular chaperone DnaK [Thermodesulfovibrionales bacterium]|nr:molecular chaperone DnaK [Thermodesulfovibrionales bacterium]
MSKVIGIDLGTTFSLAAFMNNGRPEIIPNVEGGRLTPSIVAFAEGGRQLIGSLARTQAVANPERTISSIKRRMGTDYKVEIDGRRFTPQEISSLILRKVKEDAQDYLGEKIEKAVITVPAYFNDNQRQATMEAGALAGLEVMRIINEPTAAALAYGLHKQDVHYVLIWDLGGGTFDVSILELGNGVFEVRAVGGNTHLGGDDWDQIIMDYSAENFKKLHGVDIRKDRMALQRLKEVSEKAKKELSTKTFTDIRIPFLWEKEDLRLTLSREQFEELTRDLLEKMIEPTKQALADAKLTPKQIDRVVLVGGSTRMPAVQRLARQLLGKEPYKDINPDEVVALGAAIQANILIGEIKDAVLLDVIPLSLGIETEGGIFAKIIERNTTIPTSKSQIFTTARDNQTQVDIHVLQGERLLSSDNISLGKFELTDIPPGPRGEAQIEVTFHTDANGILQVKALDIHTDNEKSIQISSSYRLSKDEINKMLEDARIHAEEDQKRKEEIQMGIRAESMIQAAQVVLEEGGTLIDENDVEKVEKLTLAIKTALSKGNYKEMRVKIDELRKLVEVVYNAFKRKKMNLEMETKYAAVKRI